MDRTHSTVSRPLSNLKKAKEKQNYNFLSKGCKSHKEAIEMASAFCAVQENHVISNFVLSEPHL